MGMAGLFASTLAFTAAAMLLLWLLSLRLRDASIVDVWWGPGFAAIAVFSYALDPGGEPARGMLAVGLSALWGLRLGAYLFLRNAGKGEDYRYQAMRKRQGPRFPTKSLFTVFWMQALLAWIVSL